MFDLREFFNALSLKLAISLAARRPPPERIPLTGPNAQKNNYILISILGAGPEDPTIAPEVFDPLGVEGHIVGASGEATRHRVPRAALDYKKVEIESIYKTHIFRHSSTLRFLVFRFLLAHRIIYRFDAFLQALFNFRFEFSSDKNKIMRDIVSWQRERLRSGVIRRLDAPFSHIDLATWMFSRRFWILADASIYLEDLRFQIESLVVSGELDHDGHNYKMSPGILVSISQFELEGRRHRDQKIHNWLIVILTSVIAVSTLLQTEAPKWLYDWLVM
jgi:hypothetical protein